MGHSYTNLLYHIVFSTKDRHAWLDEDIRPRLFEYLGGAVRGEGGIAMQVNGVADHVHILAKLRQDKAVSDVLRSVKANSSGWVHQTFRNLRAFAWQGGYGAFTVSQSQVDRVRQYIADQEKHHQRVSFQEEFLALSILRKKTLAFMQGMNFALPQRPQWSQGGYGLPLDGNTRICV